jgi:hypothetical protein
MALLREKYWYILQEKPPSMLKTLTQLFQHHTKNQQTSIERMPSTQH